MIPCDVSTCWNLTYDMLKFAAKYHAALNVITTDLDMNLHQFEWSKKEWGMTTELCNVLQVYLPSLSLKMN